LESERFQKFEQNQQQILLHAFRIIRNGGKTFWIGQVEPDMVKD
jgi:hypothetical protein